MGDGYNYNTAGVNLANEHEYLSGLVASGDAGTAQWAKEQADIYSIDLSRPWGGEVSTGGTNTVSNTGANPSSGGSVSNAVLISKGPSVSSEGGAMIATTGQVIMPSSGLEQIGVFDGSSSGSSGGNVSGGVSQWLLQPIKDGLGSIASAFSTIGQGLNLTANKFFSLLLYWGGALFLLWAFINVGRGRAGNKLISLGGK